MEFNLNYHCEKCKLYFNYKSFYEKHLISNIHINGKRKERNDKKEKPDRTIHKCSLCDYENINIQNYKAHYLKNHCTIEEKEKEFKYYCKICDFGVFTESMYNKHLETTKHIYNKMNS